MRARDDGWVGWLMESLYSYEGGDSHKWVRATTGHTLITKLTRSNLQPRGACVCGHLTWCLRALASAPTIAPRRCRPGVVTECQSVALIGVACGVAAHALFNFWISGVSVYGQLMS